MPEKGPRSNQEVFNIALAGAVIFFAVAIILFSSDLSTGESVLLEDKDGNPADFTQGGENSMFEIKFTAYTLGLTFAVILGLAFAFLNSKNKR